MCPLVDAMTWAPWTGLAGHGGAFARIGPGQLGADNTLPDTYPIAVAGGGRLAAHAWVSRTPPTRPARASECAATLKQTCWQGTCVRARLYPMRVEGASEQACRGGYGAIWLIRVDQFARAVRVFPHVPNGAASYWASVQLCAMYSAAAQMVLPSTAVAP
jgi:hypothetical protein